MPASTEWTEVPVADARILVSQTHPVAVIRHPARADRVASWADLDTGWVSPTVTVMRAPSGAWVLYRPREIAEGEVPGGAAAVHIGVDGDVIRFPGLADGHPAGATRHGLWMTTESIPHPEDEAAWLRDVRVDVLRPDGERTAHSVGRRPAFAYETDGGSHLAVYGSPPDVIAQGGGRWYRYRNAIVPLPPGELPARIDVAAAREVEEHDLMRRLEPMILHGPTVLPVDPGVQWRLVPLSPERERAAIAAVLREYGDLDAYWHAPDGRTGPLSDGLADPRIVVAGEWPDTRVEISFTHPSYPHGRLQRTLRVFDTAGRVVPTLYGSVHLMEDLDTLRPHRLDPPYPAVREI